MSHAHTIDAIDAREILDSYGNPTVEVTVRLSSGIEARAAVPAGTSTGSHEAFELRDNDPKRYAGRGVLTACEHVRSSISKILHGFDVTQQRRIDQEMIEYDKTSNLRKLGANATLGVSLACARAASIAQQLPLYVYLNQLYNEGTDAAKKTSLGMPTPMFNIFNGGKHADTNLDFQEFLIIPGGITGGVKEKIRVGAEIFHQLKHVLYNNDLDTDVGMEGGFAPNIESTPQALDMIIDAIRESAYEPGTDIQLGTDVGASVLYDKDRNIYHFGLLDHDMNSDQLISLFADWSREYPFVYIEDGLGEDDWDNWRILTEEFDHLSNEFIKQERGRGMMICGDDLFVSQVSRLQAGIDKSVGNSTIVKPNQVGTLTQTFEFVRLAQNHNYEIIVSHRSGETTDDFIADLAVAVHADYLKAGSLSRGERIVKYNRLMDIERDLEKN